MTAARVFVVLALLGCRASATMNAQGNPRCPCAAKGSLSPEDEPVKVNCAEDGEEYPWWAEAGENKCAAATGRDGDPLYPADYGDFCKEHKEPGHTSCFNVTTGLQLPAGQIAGWCSDPWCYVDPCACSAQATTSRYYDELRLAYSYDTCGSGDDYTASETEFEEGVVDYTLWGCTGPLPPDGASGLSTSLFTILLAASLVSRWLP